MSKNKFQNQSVTYQMVLIALMGAFGYLLSMVMIPYPFMPFLQIEVSEVVVIIATLMMGYHAGVMVALLKGFLHFILPFTISIFIGEIIFTTSSVIVALATYFIYCKLTKCHLLMSLTLISLLYIVLQCLSNYFIILPLYEAKPLSELAQNSAYLKTILTVYLPFNLIKMVLVSTITYLLMQKVFRLS